LDDDGTLTVEKSRLRLSAAFPTWDDAPLRAVSISVTRSAGGACGTYRCVDGTLVLDLEETADGLVLRARLLGFARAPRRLLVLGPASIAALTQGLGFSMGTGALYKMSEITPFLIFPSLHQ